MSLTLLSIKIIAKAEFLALTSFQSLAHVSNLPAGVYLHLWFSSFPCCGPDRIPGQKELQERRVHSSPKSKVQHLIPAKPGQREPGKASEAFCGSVTFLCSAQDPTRRMVSPTVGQSSHLNEQNEYNPPKAEPEAHLSGGSRYGQVSLILTLPLNHIQVTSSSSPIPCLLPFLLATPKART